MIVVKSTADFYRHSFYFNTKAFDILIFMVICKICGFITTFERLKSHMNLKHENICSFCKSKFNFQIQLENHTETNHPGTLELKYFCSECGDGFMFESSMVKHVIENKHKIVDENKLSSTDSTSP